MRIFFIFFFFFFNDTATTEIYTLSLHDALPISLGGAVVLLETDDARAGIVRLEVEDVPDVGAAPAVDRVVDDDPSGHVIAEVLDGQVVDEAAEPPELHGDRKSVV